MIHTCRPAGEVVAEIATEAGALFCLRGQSFLG